MQVPLLSNETVELRSYSVEHIEQTIMWLRQPFIRQTFGLTEEVTAEKHRAWLEKNKEVYKWAIYSKAYVGNVLLFVNAKHRSGYFQIYLGSLENTGKRIGYHAMLLVLDYAFNNLNLHRIWLHCFEENLPAIKLYQKLNFTFEGLERESILRDGQFLTQGRWSLLKPEWLARKNNL